MKTIATMALSVALLGALARAQDKVEFKTSYKKGQSYTYDMRMTQNISASFRGMTMENKIDHHLKQTDTILAVQDGKPTKVKRAYEVCETKIDRTVPVRGTMSDSIKQPYAGQTFTLVQNGDKVDVQEDTAAAKKLAKEKLLLTSGVELLLPDHPVAKGESWKLTQDQIDRLFGAERGTNVMTDASGSGTYVGMTDHGGKQVAKIQLSLSWKTEERMGRGGKAELSVTLSGPLLFDTAEGRPVSIDLEGKVKGQGQMSMEGPMKIHATVTPAS